MATGGASPPTSTAPGDQDFQELGEKDLKALFQALLPMAAQYKFFGIEIDVHNSEIQKIRSQFTNPNDCLFEILSIRLKMSPPLTWNDIDTALRSDAVGESRLANKIKKKYGHLYRPDPSLQAATSDQEGGRKISEKRKRNRKPKSARRNRLQHDSSTTGSDTMAGKDSNQAKEFSEVSGTCDRQDTSDQQHKILSKPMVPKEVHAERERHPTSDGRMGSSSYHTGRSDKSKPLRRREWKNKLKGGNKQGQDSSSEINVPLQGNEKHQIIVFERFFGQLCCEISKPVQVAAQLQRKGLISKSTMKDMIISPESQQSKTISLVDAVDKTIKSKPDCLFAFIEVLLENEALQTLGREMLREADTGRCLSELPSSMNVASTSTVKKGKRGIQETMPTMAGKQVSQLVVAPPTTGDSISVSEHMPSSVEVSQSIPQSGVSPVLTKYKQYILAVVLQC